MASVTTEARLGPEQLLTLPDSDRFELIDGQLVEKTMSFWSSYVGGVIYRILDEFCRTFALGWVVPEGVTYQCFPFAPNLVRKADVSFIRKDRLSLEQSQSEGHMRIAPDLAVEVLSPNDTVYDVDEKVEQYLAAGVVLVWVANPRTCTVKVHRRGAPLVVLHENDEISGDDVLGGFRCRVGDFFEPPPEAAVAKA